MQTADLGLAGLPRNGRRAPPDEATGRWHSFAGASRSIARSGRAIRSLLPSSKTETPLPELIAIGCFLILPWIGIVAGLHHEYSGAKAAAVRTTGNLARAAEESTRRTIGQIDYILLSARALKLAEGERFDFQRWVRTQSFAEDLTARVAMTDATGLVVASTDTLASGSSIAERMRFRAQLDPARDDLFVGRPMIGLDGGVGRIQFSRRLVGLDGAFAGVVALSVSGAELARHSGSLEQGTGFVSILSSNGTTLAGGPWASGPWAGGPWAGGPWAGGVNGRQALTTQSERREVLEHPTGSLGLSDAAGHVSDIASFRHLRDYPLIVMVGFDTDTVFGWYRALRVDALLGGAAVSCAVGLIGFFWIRQKRRSLASRRALSVTLDTISQGVLMVDRQGKVLVINPRVLDLLAGPDELANAAMKQVALRASELMTGVVNADTGRGLTLAAGSIRSDKVETALKNGTIIEIRTHALPDGGYVQTYTDVTEQRLAHAQVQYLAHHDALTGLANRMELRQRMARIIDGGAGEPDLTALIIVDLDGFKPVNDTLGHDVGDQLLIEVAGRLKALMRATDVVARLGGDEFVILLTTLREPGDVAPFAERVLRRLADPVEVDGQQIRIGASLGIAFYPRDGLDVDTLLNQADMALYSAKTGGRGVYRCFDEHLTQAVTDRRLLERDLRRALDDDALEVHFQPKFDSASLRVIGFEALARWRHPVRGFVSPDVFIRLAESCGLIDRLGRWVLSRACAAVASWEPRLPVAVNVSVMQLHNDGLKDDIAASLLRAGLAPEHLEIEVTESVLADDGQAVLANLKAIKAMGVRIALDDFGTGYSSLSYLRRFCFDKIKIDRAFVQGQADDAGVRVILEAILDMCHNLGLATVGEGVETADQLAALRERGCSEIQGYLLGRPMPAGQVQDFIRDNLGSLGGGGDASETASAMSACTALMCSAPQSRARQDAA
ncbi:bifunctional diguanylate cyclase/phosphodiesterase [Rhodopila sp.]|uniref:bifunctional diguanylate cyclase/phosphodiesterase n=1 Tax=Rhodopila sp. TaxID=2480087 RepID=UPI003D0DD85D